MLHFSNRNSNLGTESAFDVLARAQKLANDGHEIINLGIGQPDFETPGHIVDEAIQALKDGHHGYAPANGMPALREAVARDLNRRHSVTVNPENVIIVPGGKPTMFFAALMFGQEGAEIIYPNPAFPIYESVIKYSGATPIPVPLLEENNFAFSAEEILNRITDRTTLIILNSPANPTGGVTPKAEFDKLVAGLSKHPQVAILSDEIYSNMLYDGRQHISLLQYPEIKDRVILLDGWSKTYAMTGCRLGYAVWPDTCVETAKRLCINSHSCVNTAVQMAGMVALEGPQDAVEKMMDAFDRRRKLIEEALNSLPGIRCNEPAGAFYAFANVEGTGMSSNQAQDRFLEEAGVASISGTSFGAHGEGFVRFSYANSEENILRAMDKLRAIL